MPAVRSQEMELPRQLNEEPVVFNKEAGSYFRVRYDAKSLCKLAKLLREDHTRMSVVDRAQLQEDLAPLAMPNPNCKPCGIAGWVHMQEYLKKERDYIPWRTALDHLERLKKMLEGSAAETKFSRWMETLIQPYFDDRGYGMDNEKTEDEKLLKQHMVEYACLKSPIIFSSICVDEALAQFTGWMKNNSSKNPISPYLRGTFYKAVMITSGIEENIDIIAFFLSKYEEAKRTRFRHLEHFQQLREAYIDFTFAIWDPNKTRSPQEEEQGTHGFEMDEDTLCSNVEENQLSFDTSDTGIKVLKRCWYKLKENDDAAKKVKELVGEVISRKDMESLENWEREENKREDVREAVNDLTESAKLHLRCADMVANTLAEILE